MQRPCCYGINRRQPGCCSVLPTGGFYILRIFRYPEREDMYSFSDYKRSTEAISGYIGSFKPDVLLILGSGLGFLGDMCGEAMKISYEDIPNFCPSTAPGHAGNLVLGKLGGKNVCIMQGRMHCYEGHTMEEVSYPVRVARLLGAETMIVTNASGGVNREFSPGDIMLITDHIKLFQDTPLAGENIPEFGPRFNDMTAAYTPELRGIAHRVAAEQGIELREGVYMYFPGPQYETPAEIRAARVLGADAVGMSTVPEVIAARHCGMRILGFSLISNMAAGITGVELSEQEVLDAAAEAKGRFSALVTGCLERM